MQRSVMLPPDVEMAEAAEAVDESADTSAAAPASVALNGGDGKQRQNRLPSQQQASRGRNKGRMSKG